MFTGIIEEVGTVRALRKSAGGAVILIAAQRINDGVKVGDSVAVQGVCLTIVKVSASEMEADVSLETLNRSALGSLQPGDRLNLERALMPTGRLGGHMVQGHVDGVGTWDRLEPEGDGWRAHLRVPAEVARYVVDKGSIAINGVSLTVASLNGSAISVALIPHTIEQTTFKDLQPGDRVNLEADIIGKYVYKYMHPEEGNGEEDDIEGSSGRLMRKLEEGGFM
jgi:riboflavin synthase